MEFDQTFTFILVNKRQCISTRFFADKVKVPLTLLLVDEVMLDVVVLEALEVGHGGRAVVQVVVYEVVEDVAEYDTGNHGVGHTVWEDSEEHGVDTGSEGQGRRWGEDEAPGIHRGLER